MTMRWLLCLLLLMVGTVQAFQLRVHSEDPALSDEALRAEVNQVAAAVGNRIPDDPNIKVDVYSRARSSKIEGQILYYHRVQLTKAFASGPPYPTHAWLPIKSVERYGVDDAAAVRAALDSGLRAFFESLKNVDPQQGVRR